MTAMIGSADCPPACLARISQAAEAKVIRWLGRTPEGIDGPVNRLVAARRAGGRAGEASRNLLQVLLEARDEDGRPLTDAEIGDEVATFLLAGHRRPASVGTV